MLENVVIICKEDEAVLMNRCVGNFDERADKINFVLVFSQVTQYRKQNGQCRQSLLAVDNSVYIKWRIANLVICCQCR